MLENRGRPDSMCDSFALFLISSTLLLSPLFYKLLQLCLVYLRVPRNAQGKRLPGELPKLPWGHFNQVNFFGRPLSKKHGSIYYIWHCLTPVIILADAKAIRTFYSDHYSHQRDPDFTCLGVVFKDILGNCLATSHGRDEVKRCRGPFEKYFSTEVVSKTLRVIGQECKSFMESLPVGQPVDLQTGGLADVTLRVLVHVVYGEDVLNKFFQRILELSGLLQGAVDMLNVGETRLPFYSLLPTKANQKARRFNEAWNEFNRFLFKEYEEGRLDAGDGFFFAMMELLKTHALEMDEKELFHSVDEILLLNIDVSFAATSFALADLAQYKNIQDKVQQEIDAILQGDDPSSLIDLEKRLPYMEIVLKESARVHPALALSLPEKTVKQVTDLGGYQIPKGTPICVDTHSLNFSEQFWENPDKFDPERFANGSRQVPGSFFRFGMGPRKCLGYRYALAINRVVVASVMQKFSLEIAQPSAPLRVKEKGMTFFTPYLSPIIIFNARNGKSAHTTD
ncbi:uncharacterized protein [Montipora capricornis]|uniref:uncharacterized protein isoform X1 n=1 Tax=Montipora capricornis TaxID=246305 RepID=UPI0035F20018